MIRWRLVALGIVTYVLSLAVFFPAGWIAPVFERVTDGAVVLGDSRGTIWHGGGTIALRSGGVYKRLADIDWRCNPLWLVTGRMRVALSASAPDADIRASMSIGMNSVRIDELQADASASLAESVFPMLAVAGPEGRLRARAADLEITRTTVNGAATLEWERAGLRQWQWSNLGDYRIDATGSGERTDFKLTTLRGDLRLSGAGEWRIARPDALQLNGIAENPNGRKDLDLLLRMIGRGAVGPRQSFSLTLPIR